MKGQVIIASIAWLLIVLLLAFIGWYIIFTVDLSPADALGITPTPPAEPQPSAMSYCVYLPFVVRGR